MNSQKEKNNLTATSADPIEAIRLYKHFHNSFSKAFRELTEQECDPIYMEETAILTNMENEPMLNTNWLLNSLLLFHSLIFTVRMKVE